MLATGLLLAAGGTARAIDDDSLRYTDGFQVAPGVRYREFTVHAVQGDVHGHLLVADLTDRAVSADLLRSRRPGEPLTVSSMADGRGAVAGINGDFFDVDESQHPGVAATDSAVGPAISAGVGLKAAVPRRQRFGPALPPGTSVDDVLGVDRYGVARIDRLTVTGRVGTPHGSVPVAGLNQYALPENGVGVYTPQWGSASRLRAVCGSDHRRAASCSTATREVTVRGGRVTAVRTTPGGGPVAPGTLVLVGREAGARALAGLRPGDRVRVTDALSEADEQPPAPDDLVPVSYETRTAVRAASPTPLSDTLRGLNDEVAADLRRQAQEALFPPLRFAVGGFPVLRHGQALDGLDEQDDALRASAGYGPGGHRLYLMALDGGDSCGVTLRQLAEIMSDLGAVDAVNVDGGGSATLVAREPGDDRVSVLNHPSDGSERQVAYGIGLFG